MAEYKVAVIPGDGVGLEVIDEGRKALEAVAGVTDGLSLQFTEFPWGSEFYRETGKLMPDDGIETLKGFDTILFGAVGDPDIPDHITQAGLLPVAYTKGTNFKPAARPPVEEITYLDTYKNPIR